MEEFPYGTDFFNISNETELAFLSKSNDGILSNGTNLSELVRSYDNIPTWILLLILFILPFGMVLNVFIIKYERYEMDSMKRGLFNQVG